MSTKLENHTVHFAGCEPSATGSVKYIPEVNQIDVSSLRVSNTELKMTCDDQVQMTCDDQGIVLLVKSFAIRAYFEFCIQNYSGLE